MPLLLAWPMFHSSSSSKSPNCSFDATSLAWPSFCSTPSLISQQSLAPGVSHIFGGWSVLKMRQASIDLPSNSDLHGPGAPPLELGADTRKARTTPTIDFIGGRYIMTPRKGG